MNTEVFPAAMKTAMRYHLRRLCETSHCVDTLVLYLNSPSKTDGTMLLWDVNKNGKVNKYNLLSSQMILKLYTKLKTYLKICYFLSGMFLLLLLSYHNHPLQTRKLRLHSFSTWKGLCWDKKIKTFLKMNYEIENLH